ncbi:MAG TPA: hypothetical protein VMP89_13055 [Solirubrobacteraceae bacterium]|nr:hypothetical protein [Solirubrobacteraceae bacterium]
MAPEPDALDLDLVTASLRADTTDLQAFVEALAIKLEDVLPGRVRVDRRRSGLRGPKVVNRITINAGDRRLELVSDGGALETRGARLSGGIVLKTEMLDIDAWLAAVSEALAAEAGRSEKTRQALERLLID